MQPHDDQSRAPIVRDLRQFLRRIAVRHQRLGMQPAAAAGSDRLKPVFGDRAAIGFDARQMEPGSQPGLHRLDHVDQNQRHARRVGEARRDRRLVARGRRRSTGTTMRRSSRFASSSEIGPGSTGGVISTGRVVSRSTRSVVDPKNNLRTR